MFGLTFTTPVASQPHDIASIMAVNAAISYSDQLIASGISVTQECGVLYLDGTVLSVEMRDEAQRIAMDVTDLPVRNRIRVAS